MSFGTFLSKVPGSSLGSVGNSAGESRYVCGNMHVRPCALVLLPGSPGISGSNQYKCNLRPCRASGEREKAWRELITGQEEEQDGESGALGARWALPRKDGVRLR